MPSKRFAEYVELCRQHHIRSKTFSGKGCLKHRIRLLGIAREVEATSALDYGAGKCGQYAMVNEIDGKTLEQALGFAVTKYDPAVPGIDQKPAGPFDFVWCTDVMEHIPEEDIAWVLEDIASLASKAVFLTISTAPSKKSLPNGENAHVTVKSSQWWTAKIVAMKRAHPALRVEYQIA